MRSLGPALVLSFWAAFAAAFEVEDRRVYPGTGDTVLRILSTADLAAFEPFILDFQRANPELGIDYTVASSTELERAIRSGAAFDLALSSAMDLQFRLANDGYARPYRSEATAALPGWARWRDRIFAFTREPSVVVVSRARFAGLPLPGTRQELISILRENPDRFHGRIGTYDVRDSGLGYLFATQEARSSDAYWRLTEVMGRLDARLYCCSGDMIEDVAEGRLAVAYNVLGSYADRLRGEDDRIAVLTMQDYSNVMLRTALVPVTAVHHEAAGRMLDALLRAGLGEPGTEPALPPLTRGQRQEPGPFAPIRLGPALMIYLDRLNRQAFLAAWQSAMEQD